MMNQATFANRSLGKDIISSLDFALLSTPSESDSMAELDFPWTNLAKDSQCIASAIIGPYTPTDDEFTSGFELKDNAADPLTFAPRRSIEQSVDGLDPSSPSFLILGNQDFDADVLPYCHEAHDATSSEPSPTSTRPERSRASTCSATPVGQSGAPDIERQREKNRVAARKCRQKTKQNVAGLQRREKELGQQNKVLVSCVRSLREEVLDLKTEILKHSNCDNIIIQKYIANAARRQIE
ncbi:hypothetical protein F4860DRAFT_512055 [Xylaria cubensis]|nr:hypothetical protein F4860DRAFT_512055 [Xylaria cubensis]